MTIKGHDPVFSAFETVTAGPFRGPVKWRIIIALTALAYGAVLPGTVEITGALLRRQDRWLLVVEAVVLISACLFGRSRAQPFKAGARYCLAGSVAIALACMAGHHWLLCDFDLSRDEQMANFDALVFAGGHWVQPLPSLWRDHADALNTLFMYPAEHRAAWISSYLPMNAALRAMSSLLGNPALVGPFMTLAGGVALWGCARRIWPHDRETAVVTTLLYLGSGQVLFAGMTAYAMPAHLTLNLIWLWLYLKRTWPGDGLAVAVGCVAMGLHQPIVHVMFAGPLLYLTIREKEWRRAAFFAVGYGLAGAFWLWWPNWTWTLVQATAHAPRPAGVDFLSRLKVVMQDGNYIRTLPYMVLNLLRFVAWQHILLLPLLGVGLAATRGNPLARAIAAGLWLTAGVMTVILPNQGHGFGYRYFHGVIGNAILIAVHGWKQLGASRPAWRGLLTLTSALGLMVVVPMQSWMAHAQYAPYARLDARIAASRAGYVMIGSLDAPYARDLVYNPPGLDRGPVRLLRELVDPPLAADLCASHTQVTLVRSSAYQSIARFFTSPPRPQADEDNAMAETMLRRAGCSVVYLS